MNKLLTIPAIALSMIISFGCRQRDISTVSISVPQISATDNLAQGKVIAALSVLDGVDKSSIKFDDGKLELSYDTMKLGLKNIEHAIMDIGYDVNDFKGKKR